MTLKAADQETACQSGFYLYVHRPDFDTDWIVQRSHSWYSVYKSLQAVMLPTDNSNVALHGLNS